MKRNERRRAQGDHFDTLFDLASSCSRQGRIDEAIDYYHQALTVRPDSESARDNLGLLLASVGRLPEAVANFQHAISLQPQLADAHYSLALTLQSQGLLAEAIDHYLHAIELKPAHILARIELGNCLVDDGQLSEALDQAEMLVHFIRQPSFPHFRFAMLLVRCDCIDVARASFESYLAQYPDDQEGARQVMAELGLAPLPEHAAPL
jgi:protein O-GlcNAc transferase